MGDANDFTRAIKKAAMDAFEASKPVNVFFGKVTSASPLKINVEQKMTLGDKQLVLTRSVTDYNTLTSNGNIKVFNALKVGDEVVLIRQQEGQKFIVIDRLG